MDPQLKQLMKELGDAINQSLSDSKLITEVVSRIKHGGYDIFLSLRATIGLSKEGGPPRLEQLMKERRPPSTKTQQHETAMTPQLKQLMKELGDSINESLSDSEQISRVVSRVKEVGYEVSLCLKATIGVSAKNGTTDNVSS